MKNDSLKVIGETLKEAKSVLLFPHILMDGDAMGSAAALCAALREEGVSSYVVIEDKIPEYLKFLDKGYTLPIEKAEEVLSEDPDITLCIDCGEEKRFPKRTELFRRGRCKICLDHHVSTEGIGQLNYIDPTAAATGEIVFDLLEAMGVSINGEMADALFAAITTDTGNYQYANTTARSHAITEKLYAYGMNSYKTSVALYESQSLAKLKLHSLLIEAAEQFAGGEAIITALTQEMLQKTGTLMEDTEGVVGTLRSITGVEVAVFLKEQEDGSIKVSFRSKNKGDVSILSRKYDGGGHVRAAGCTLRDMPLSEAKALMMKEVTAILAVE